MKILFAIQGTGNGHIARASEIVPILKRRGEVDILISSSQFNLNASFDVDYKLRGLYYIFGKLGGIDIYRTILHFNPLNLINDVKKFPIGKYDLIISDFEPISSWAAKYARKPCIGLGNLFATLHPLAPKPKKWNLISKFILRNYCPTTSTYGLHFKSLGKNVYTPIIRNEIRKTIVSNKGHYTIYLPSYDDEVIIRNIDRIKTIKWELFSRFTKRKIEIGNITILPINEELFIKSISTASGVISHAGFGVSSEALFLRKKLLVIPMKWQYEQFCNAAMLESMGVCVIDRLSNKFKDDLLNWIDSDMEIEINYPDQTEEIIENIIDEN